MQNIGESASDVYIHLEKGLFNLWLVSSCSLFIAHDYKCFLIGQLYQCLYQPNKSLQTQTIHNSLYDTPTFISIPSV